MPRRRNQILRGSKKRKKKDEQFQRWCFTLNFEGRTAGEIREEGLLRPIEEPIGYRIYQLEAGETGTLHFQGYFESRKGLTLRECKQLEGYERAHFEPAGGDLEDNRKYCSKEPREAGPFEEGDPCVKQGKRSDLDRLKVAIEQGCSNRELYDIHFPSAVRYYRGLQQFRAELIEPRTKKPNIRVYYGEAGAGKSRRARAICRGRGWSCYPKNNTKWWDGYLGQECVLWDDFDYTKVDYNELLLILDRYEHRIEFKGGSCMLNSPYIFITSNYHPKDWYPSQLNQKALLRRIDKIIHFKEKPDEPVEMPHECENSDDSLDEGEVMEAGEDEQDYEMVYVPSDDEPGELVVPGAELAGSNGDETHLMEHSEISEESREEIRKGKREATPPLELD